MKLSPLRSNNSLLMGSNEDTRGAMPAKRSARNPRRTRIRKRSVPTITPNEYKASFKKAIDHWENEGGAPCAAKRPEHTLVKSMS